MKKTFKLISILLVLFVGVFALTGCNNKNQSNTNETVNETVSETVNDDKGEIYLQLDTEGLGQVSYYIDDERKVDFDDEYPKQQAYIRLDSETTATINAKADNDWKFVKWTKDGKEYSTDPELEITVNDATELTAVFTIYDE